MRNSHPLETKLAKAKTSLVLEHPFIGTIALNMPFIISETPPEGFPPGEPWTACTDGKRIEFNPAFIEPMSDEQLKFLVAHECMHPMLEHNYRRQGRVSGKWNRAADYVINQILTDDHIGTMPEGGCYNPQLYQAGNGVTDGIYQLLPDEPEGTDGNGSGWQDCMDAPGNQAAQDQAAAEMKVQVAQAAQAAKMAGKLSAGMERLVDEVLNPKVDWRDVLRRFMVKAKKGTRTWSRPNRRLITQGIFMPTRTGEVMGEIAFAIDCSGSIGQEELNQFAAEVITVQQDHRPKKIHCIYFDSSVSHHDEYQRGEDVEIQPHGGGGTAFSPVFEFMAENGIEPAACVFLTDLYCNDFGDTPPYPVLWVSNGRDGEDTPFGETVMM